MIRKYSAYTFIFAMLFATACSTLNVRHVDTKGEMPKSDGVYYSLPKTGISVEVTVNKTHKIKGPYSIYADKYLGISNVITANSVSYSLGDIKLNSYSIPDPDQYYFVESTKGCFKKQPLLLELTEAGLVSSINKSSEIKSVINPETPSVDAIEELNEPTGQFSVNSNIAESFDTIIEKVNLDTITIEKKVLKKILVEKTLEQKAKEAADFIMRVKQSAFDLISGLSEVNYTKESFEYMNEQLKKSETEYLNLFTGITIKQQLKYHFTYVPESAKNSITLPLFRFSEKEGVADTTSNKGESVYLSINGSGNTNSISSFIDKKTNIKKKAHGLYYRIPDNGKVSIAYNNKEKADANILINQYGVVTELPYDKNIKLLFYPNSGTIKSVEIK
ncbi:MAG: DUF4831 family protein [Bacteroidetes bacterium]|nr:DUF4831 family protein [Bacteroidota bacterium]